MLISNQQQYVLDILRRLGCVRRAQLEAFLRLRFCREHPDVAAGLTNSVLRQLKYGNTAVRLEGDVALWPGHTAEPHALEAIDVMLELSEGEPLEYSATQPKPILLRFSVSGERISLFAVLHAEDLEQTKAMLTPPPEFSPTERVIILFDGEGRPPGLSVSNRQYFAMRQENGTHRFFAKDDKEEE